MEVFLIKWGMGTLCFLENGSFLTIYWHGMGALIFSWNSLFWPGSVYRVDVFLTKYGHANRGFLIKNWKKWRQSNELFREWTLFWQNMGMRGEIFSWKIGKKGASFGLFWPILKCSFNRSYPFFWPNMAMTAEGLSYKIWKEWH